MSRILVVPSRWERRAAQPGSAPHLADLQRRPPGARQDHAQHRALRPPRDTAGARHAQLRLAGRD